MGEERSTILARSVTVGVGLVALLAQACALPLAVKPPPPAPAAAAPVRPPPPRPTPVPVQPAPKPEVLSGVLGRSEEYVVVAAQRGDTLELLAAQYLGDPGRAWVIADFNRVGRLLPGQEVVIPLLSHNPVGVHSDGVQTVPILCYHRFGDEKARMVVSATAFAAQMNYLAENDYRVVPLRALVDFLAGKAALPKRAVVITMDDGYKSNYQIAFPILQRHRFPATIFLYTDFANARAGLTWAEMRAMVDSGLISIQAHSKAHSNLAMPTPGEGESQYGERLDLEISVPTATLRQRLGVPPLAFAYPYGDANPRVIDRVRAAEYRLAATVQAGGNPAFAYPFMLRRTMVYGDDDLAAFQRKLEVFRPLGLK